MRVCPMKAGVRRLRWSTIGDGFHRTFAQTLSERSAYLWLDVRRSFVPNLGYCAGPLLPKSAKSAPVMIERLPLK